MSEKLTSDSFHSFKGKDEVDLGKIFRFILMQSKLIILIVFSVLLFHMLTTAYQQKNI